MVMMTINSIALTFAGNVSKIDLNWILLNFSEQ